MVEKRLVYALVLFAATVFHIFFVDYLSFFILAFTLALPAVSLLITFFARRGVKVEIEVKSLSVQKKERMPVRLRVNNIGFMTCLIRVKLVIRNELLQEEETEMFFITAGRTEQTVEQNLSSQYCGKLDFRIKELRIYDCLGLFSFRQKTLQEQSCTVFVLPELFPLIDADRSLKIHEDAVSNEFSPSKAGDDPSELIDIREYRKGDRISRIHWKLSDRQDRLMVRDFGLPISNKVLLLFDLNGSNLEVDGLLDTLYSISFFFLQNQIVHEIEWYDSLRGCFMHTTIAEEGDLNTSLNVVLSECRPQLQPLVLQNCCGSDSGDAGQYSQVIYLCSGITPDFIALFRDRMAESRIHILLVKEGGDLKEAGARAKALGVNITAVDLENIGQSLSTFTL